MKTPTTIAVRTICIVWVEVESQFYGPEVRVDLGERRRVRDVKTAKATCWMNFGTDEDVERARKYASAQGTHYGVFECSTTSSTWAKDARAWGLANLNVAT